MSGKPVYLLALNLAMSALGLLCCIILALRVRREMQANRCKRLLRRQLFSLALAGIIVTSTGMPILMIDLSNLPAAFDKPACAVSYSLLTCFRCIVIFQQTHLGIAFFVQCVKWTSCLPILNGSIGVLWLAGIIVGVADTVFAGERYNQEFGTCDQKTNKPDYIFLVATGLCLFVSVVASMATLIMSLKLPLKVARSNYKRATWYPLVTVVTFGLPMAGYLSPGLRHEPAWFWPLATLAECSNFPLTTGVFLLQAHFARQEASAIKEPINPCDLEASTCTCSTVRQLGNFHVNFGGVDVVDILVMPEPATGTIEVVDEANTQAPTLGGLTLLSSGSERSPASESKIRIKVTGQSRVPGVPTAFAIAISQGSRRYSVYRRCDELQTLKKALQKRLPQGTVVPQAPRERCLESLMECVDESFQERRMRAVEEFIRKCLALEDTFGTLRDVRELLGDYGVQRSRSKSPSRSPTRSPSSRQDAY